MLAKLCTFSSYIIRAIYIHKVLLGQSSFLSAPVLFILKNAFTHVCNFSIFEKNKRKLFVLIVTRLSLCYYPYSNENDE